MPSPHRAMINVRPIMAAIVAAIVATGLSATVATASVAAGDARPAAAATAPAAVPFATAGPRTSIGQGTLIRVDGSDRIMTSVAASKAGFPLDQSASALVLARADQFADALAGGPLATEFHGPLLLTLSAGLTPEVRAEILRVLPLGHVVYLLGGFTAISAGVDTDLTTMGYVPTRISGVDRFDTAVKIADALGDPPNVFEVDGTNFPDGLSAGPAATQAHGAVLLTDGSHPTAITSAYLVGHSSIERYAIGGPAALADPTAQPLVGVDRYATSVVVARQLFSSPSAVAVASGEAFPDALSGGAAAGLAGIPIILVPATGPLTNPVEAYLNGISNTVVSAWLFGGITAVNTAVAREIAQALVLVPPDV